MRLSDFKVLTFDCYGTLIDWESGIIAALRPLIEAAGNRPAREAALEAFARHESEQEQATPHMIYSDLLSEVHRRLAREWKVELPETAHRAFGGSVGAWPAFADSAPSLAYLKRHYKLAILSNVDRTSFARSNQKLGVEFDAIYTAQDIGSYKPSLRNFEFMLERLGALGYGTRDILHTAQSLYHDHVPANRVGLVSAWIDRRKGQAGSGATKTPAQMPRIDFHFSSLGEMADAHRRE